jgi:hypothetical protein
MSLHDSLGVEILPTDTVRVTSWGIGARLTDVGQASPVVRINRTRIVVHVNDEDRAVNPTEVNVLRRDGQPGHEGNRHRFA